MSDTPFVYPGKSVHIVGGDSVSVPLGAGPPFPHVVVEHRPDGTFVLRRAAATDPWEIVREPGNGPEPERLGAADVPREILHRPGQRS